MSALTATIVVCDATDGARSETCFGWSRLMTGDYEAARRTAFTEGWTRRAAALGGPDDHLDICPTCTNRERTKRQAREESP